MINGDLGDTEISVVTYPYSLSLSLSLSRLWESKRSAVRFGVRWLEHCNPLSFSFFCGKTVCAQPMHIILHIILALMGASPADSTSTLQGMCVTGHFCPVCFDVSPSSYLTMVVL